MGTSQAVKLTLVLSGAAVVQSVFSTPLPAQQLSDAELDSVLSVYAEVVRVVENHGSDLWPGFRPDTTPLKLVIRERGTLLLGWSGELPEGMSPVEGVPQTGWVSEADRAAASFATTINSRSVAQLSIGDFSPTPMFALMIHEAFHVFERANRSDDALFGGGENSFLVTRYPIFDIDNETGVALEGRVLAEAISGNSDDADAFARELVALREQRHRRMGVDLAEFEFMAELNEGLAQYVQVRALELVADERSVGWWREALAEANSELARLDNLTSEQTQSFRRRFYTTGTGLGKLLDRLAQNEWKRQLMEQNLTLQGAIAVHSGYRARETVLRNAAEQRHDVASISANAEHIIAARRTNRQARLDSILSQPGILIELSAADLPNGNLGMCGIDPQNILQVDAGVLLHTRWLRVCGFGVNGEFNTPVVHDRSTGLMRAVIGEESSVSITMSGEVVTLSNVVTLNGAHLESDGLELDIPSAEFSREGRILRIRLLPN